MAHLERVKNINAQTDEFISQVDSFLNSKKGANPNIQMETTNFLNLLGRVESDERIPPDPHQKENSLSVIYSISSEGSSVQDTFRKTNRTPKTYQFVQRWVQEMSEYFAHSKSMPDVASLYYQQMGQIDAQQREIVASVMTVTQSMDALKRRNQTLSEENQMLRSRFDKSHAEYVQHWMIQFQQIALNRELDKVRLVETELVKSLEQAQTFNDRLSKLLQLKVQEQRYKDSQCKQIQVQLVDLSTNVNEFQNQFVGINSLLKNLFERIQDLWSYNNEHQNTNKIIEGILDDSHLFIDKINVINSMHDSQPTSANSKLGQSDSHLKHSSSKRIPNKATTLSNFRNHFVVTPQKIPRREDNNSSDRSNNSARKHKSARRSDIEAQYRKIFRSFK